MSNRALPMRSQWTLRYGKPLRPTSPYPPGRCKTCGVRLAGRRTAYCSDDCANEWGRVWYGKTAPHWLRMHTFLRDGSTCQDCGISPRVDWWMRVRRREPLDLFLSVVTFGWDSLDWDNGASAGGSPRPANRWFWKPSSPAVVGWVLLGKFPDWPKLEMHHVLPLCEGGDDSPDNLVTLCHDCHLARHGAVPHYKRILAKPRQAALFAEVGL